MYALEYERHSFSDFVIVHRGDRRQFCFLGKTMLWRCEFLSVIPRDAGRVMPVRLHAAVKYVGLNNRSFLSVHSEVISREPKDRLPAGQSLNFFCFF